jgi:hypothetical protein
MNRALAPLLTSKPPDRSRVTDAFHHSSLKSKSATDPIPPQTPLPRFPIQPMTAPAKIKFLSEDLHREDY